MDGETDRYKDRYKERQSEIKTGGDRACIMST